MRCGIKSVLSSLAFERRGFKSSVCFKYVSFRCFGDYNDLPEIIINNDNLIPSKVRLSHLNLFLLPTLVEIKLWIIKLNFKKT